LAPGNRLISSLSKTPSILSWPVSLEMAHQPTRADHAGVDMPSQYRGHLLGAAVEVHRCQLHAGRLAEGDSGHVGRGHDPAVAHLDRVGRGLGSIEQILGGLVRTIPLHDQPDRLHHSDGHRRQVLPGEGSLPIGIEVYDGGRRHGVHTQGVAVGLGLRHLGDTQLAAGTGLGHDLDLSPQILLHPGGELPREEVVDTAGRPRGDNSDRLALLWIVDLGRRRSSRRGWGSLSGLCGSRCGRFGGRSRGLRRCCGGRRGSLGRGGRGRGIRAPNH